MFDLGWNVSILTEVNFILLLKGKGQKVSLLYGKYYSIRYWEQPVCFARKLFFLSMTDSFIYNLIVHLDKFSKFLTKLYSENCWDIVTVLNQY